MSFLEKEGLSSIRAPKEELNRSVDDLRQSFSDLRRSKINVQEARAQLRLSKKQFLESKEEIRDSLEQTKVIRNKLRKDGIVVENSIEEVQQKKRRLKVELMQRYDNLRKKLDDSLTASLEKLNDVSTEEILNLRSHRSYLDNLVRRYDKASVKIRNRLEDDDYDMNVSELRRQARNLGDVGIVKEAPISTLFYRAKSLPLFKTNVTGPEAKPTVPKFATPMKKKRTQRKKKAKVHDSKLKYLDDDEESVVTTASTVSSVGTEDLRATTNANRWAYHLTVKYRETDTDETRTVRGTCFLVWDSRLNTSIFVTAKSLLERAWEEQILSIKAENMTRDQELYFTRRSVVFAGEYSQIAFIKVPAKKGTLEGFSLIDTRKVGLGGMGMFFGFGLGFVGSGRDRPDMGRARLRKKRGDVMVFDKAMDRGVIGGPVLTDSGRLIGVFFARDMVDDVSSVCTMDLVFRQYLTYCT